jgi:hypothetical protein
LKEFGAQPALYSFSLQPILIRFVETFRNPHNLLIRQFWNDIVTITPKQKFCTTTSTVTGWINAFHHWDESGNLMVIDEATAKSETLILDKVTFPWRPIHSLPTAYNSFPMCVFGDKGSARYEMMAGMLGVIVNKGAPEGYATAMQSTNSSLPTTISSSDHSTLQPLPFYALYRDRTVSVSSIIFL